MFIANRVFMLGAGYDARRDKDVAIAFALNPLYPRPVGAMRGTAGFELSWNWPWRGPRRGEVYADRPQPLTCYVWDNPPRPEATRGGGDGDR